MTALTIRRTIPACCTCDPAVCEADDTGEHCITRSCGSCLHGCPAPDGECCSADPTGLTPATVDVPTGHVALTLDGHLPAGGEAMRWMPPELAAAARETQNPYATTPPAGMRTGREG